MLSRSLAVSVAAVVLCAVTASTQTVTFSTTTYPKNNLWSQSAGPNGHMRADLNGDGREDFISENDGSFAIGCTGSFGVTLSTGDGKYAAPVCYTIPSGVALYFAVGDFNADGTLDVMVTNEAGMAYEYLNNGKGTLHLANTFTLDAEAGGIVAADVNHNGKIDLVYDTTLPSGASTLNVLFGNGDGTFSTGPITSFNMANEPASALGIGDFDSDGHVDVLVLGASGVENEILYGDGTGHFTPGPIVGGRTTGYVGYDIANTGMMDLIGAPFGSNPSGLNTYYNYLDIEWTQHNRTLTSQHLMLKSCTADNAPPVVADFNGDGINDIIVAEGADCLGNGPYTLNVLLGNANGSFKPEQVIYSTPDWISEWHVMRASHSSKPDLTVWQATVSQRQISNAEQLVLANTTTGGFPACTPMNYRATQIDVCSPTSSTGATSPVKFSFGASNQTPGRDMELWIDGKKVNENHKNAYSYYNFLNASVPLSNGEHTVTAYAVGWDYSLLSTGMILNVGNDTCPVPSYVGLNVCSPIQNGTAGSPVLAYARGNAGGPISRMEIWVDGVKKYSTYGSDTLKTSIPLATGWHTFTYYIVPVQGGWLDSQTQEIAVP
jgi:hypothetical protein